LSELPPLPATPLGRYRHYKGGEYEVVGAARHSETLEPLVVYRPLYNASGLWTRPHAMFFEEIEVDGKRRPRFERIEAAGKQPIEQECNRVLDDFMAALNAYDAAGMDRCMHFPHPRVADGKVIVYDKPGNNPMDLFDRLKKADGWSHSRWEQRELVQCNADKAHFKVSYTRFRADGSVIGVYDSLYILTRQDGRWGIQARSSFGP
jgi:hypothetical protein